MAGKRPRIAELYRTRGDSLPAVDITRANFRAVAVPDSQGTRCPDEWPGGGRTGSYPSCAGSEQLGDRGAERCGRALGNEANVVGLQDEEASYNSTCRGPTETKRPRRGWRRLSFPSRHSTGGSESDGNSSVADIRRRFVTSNSRIIGLLPYKTSTARSIFPGCSPLESSSLLCHP